MTFLHTVAEFDFLKLQDGAGISVVLISNHQRLAQTRSHSVVEFSAITSRIDIGVSVSKPTLGDLKSICVEHNVEFEAIEPMLRIGEKETQRQFVRLAERARMIYGDAGAIKLVHIHAAVSSNYSTKEAAQLLAVSKKVT